ncbi:MAG: phosphoribosylformylglycinamidine synthase subunit PurS [Acidobacteria bacterium]|jgi:phosphoribosylformylglycinamidine synthase|nr:phosphoribosylformylglycinamidine synthase subunit PurS [Acidobacteriota bacterium]
MKARVHVFLKEGVLDPQGKAVASALQTLGFEEVLSVRQGKFFDIETSSLPKGANEERLKEYCKKLLANPVIENFKVEVIEP